MTVPAAKHNNAGFLILVGLAAWIVPGAGHLILKEKTRGLIILVSICLTFVTGLYVGSIGVIDPVGSKAWYVGQLMVSPLVAVIGSATAGGAFPVYGRPSEIGQIYTSIAGLLNLLCIVNAVYTGYMANFAAKKD